LFIDMHMSNARNTQAHSNNSARSKDTWTVKIIAPENNQNNKVIHGSFKKLCEFIRWLCIKSVNGKQTNERTTTGIH